MEPTTQSLMTTDATYRENEDEEDKLDERLSNVVKRVMIGIREGSLNKISDKVIKDFTFDQPISWVSQVKNILLGSSFREEQLKKALNIHKELDEIIKLVKNIELNDYKKIA